MQPSARVMRTGQEATAKIAGAGGGSSGRMRRVEVMNRTEVSHRDPAGASPPQVGYCIRSSTRYNCGRSSSLHKYGIATSIPNLVGSITETVIMQTPYKNKPSSQSDRVSTKLYAIEKTRSPTNAPPTDLSGTAVTLPQHNPAFDKNMKQLPLQWIRNGMIRFAWARRDRRHEVWTAFLFVRLSCIYRRWW